MQRKLITIVILLVAAALTIAIVKSQNSPSKPVEQQTQQAPASNAPASTDAAPVEAQAAHGEPAAETPAAPVAVSTYKPIAGLKVQPITESQPEPTIGSTEKDEKTNPYELEAQFTPWGAGIKYVKLSRYSTSVKEHIPYTVQEKLELSENPATQTKSYRYPMAAFGVIVNGGKSIYLDGSDANRWRVIADKTDATHAAFEITLVDGDNKPVLRLTRIWSIQKGRFDLHLDQQVENLSDQSLQVRFTQLGPIDTEMAGGYLGDRRKIVACYLQPRRSNPNLKDLTTDGMHLTRASVLKDKQKYATIWPQADADSARDMVWVTLTNRYFAAAVHTDVTAEDKAIVPLERKFSTVRTITWSGDDPLREKMGLLLDSVPMTLTPKSDHALTIDLYTGPQDPAILKNDPAYAKIALGDMIEYNIGSMCAFCTFAWLANFLMAFLGFIHTLVADWGVAIIVLVAIVRLILHPLTKYSQVNMMKVGKQMQGLQPEIKKLKEKYKDNQTKLNQETMALYRERHVNPASMGLGCLPMFLQMPIWFALYAMLFFAIELRHQPAFYGIFQTLTGGKWMFLADLSSQDGFIRLPEISLYFTHINSINLLPILMAFVFFIQQKYTAQTTPQMSDQSATQQKMMKWMVLLFPIFLYKAPSGLTLYILTSTAVGIIESKRVRDHIKQMEDDGHFDMSKPAAQKKAPKAGGFMDRMMKAAEERQRQAQKQKSSKSSNRGKKRR